MDAVENNESTMHMMHTYLICSSSILNHVDAEKNIDKGFEPSVVGICIEHLILFMTKLVEFAFPGLLLLNWCSIRCFYKPFANRISLLINCANFTRIVMYDS